jgi:futalosine hydrolase
MAEHIIVAGAVSAELAPIKAALNNIVERQVGGRAITEGMLGGTPVRLTETGPGLINTTQSLTAMLETLSPMMILMVGCAGGFKQAGMNVGDIGVATAEIDAQLGIEPRDKNESPLPLPFDLGMWGGERIKNRIEMNDNLASYASKVIRQSFILEEIAVKKGPFITVSTITSSDQRAALLFKQFHPCMESMEGVAGAYVAGYYGVPFIEIRSASNIVGDRQRDAWNLPLACQRSSLAAISFIQESKGRSPS